VTQLRYALYRSVSINTVRPTAAACCFSHACSYDEQPAASKRFQQWSQGQGHGPDVMRGCVCSPSSQQLPLRRPAPTHRPRCLGHQHLNTDTSQSYLYSRSYFDSVTIVTAIGADFLKTSHGCAAPLPFPSFPSLLHSFTWATARRSRKKALPAQRVAVEPGRQMTLSSFWAEKSASGKSKYSTRLHKNNRKVTW